MDEDIETDVMVGWASQSNKTFIVRILSSRVLMEERIKSRSVLMDLKLSRVTRKLNQYFVGTKGPGQSTHICRTSRVFVVFRFEKSDF